MVTDEVVASTAQTMEDTLRYLDAQYGGIKRYLHIIGISDAEVSRTSTISHMRGGCCPPWSYEGMVEVVLHPFVCRTEDKSIP